MKILMILFGLRIDPKIGFEIKDFTFLYETPERVLLFDCKLLNCILKRPQLFKHD
jgi:hypothetical protein